MLYTPTELITNGQHVEELLIWSALCLEDRVAQGAPGYERIELDNSGIPVPPLATDVIRIQSGPNYGKALFRASVRIQLDTAKLWGDKLFYSAIPFSATDTIPTKLAGQ